MKTKRMVKNNNIKQKKFSKAPRFFANKKNCFILKQILLIKTMLQQLTIFFG